MARRPLREKKPIEENKNKPTPKNYLENDFDFENEEEEEDSEVNNPLPYGWNIPQPAYTVKKRSAIGGPIPESIIPVKAKSNPEEYEGGPFGIVGAVVFITSVVVITLVLAGMYKFLHGKPKSFDVNDHGISADEEVLENYIEELKQDFPSQDENTWFTFLSGIKSVIRENPNKPSVFLLLYEGDEETANCLAKRVSRAGIKYLKGKQNRPVILKGHYLKTNMEFIRDPGEVIPAYNKDVERECAMVVTELHEVPGPIAQIFHYFCDRESPLVSRAVYFFTLKNQRRFMQSVQRSAESTLEKLWNTSLTENLLAPLITRLTGNTLQIHPESYVHNCD